MCYKDGKFSMCALNVIFSNGLLTRRVKLRAGMGLSWSSNRKQSVKGIGGVLTFFSVNFIYSLSTFEQLDSLVTPASEIRRAAKETALREINSQREQFRSLGIMANWDSKERTYRTFGMFGLRTRCAFLIT